ncbi:10898_t:CDS:2 [Acaulospora colombiana]|uniref:10898_t:CDS:1 n=1 Tax=Acaulospora colombiana TaxID=27376 RepID=A0ACA9K768_9GLOM|nr:10898_t:CDS:2 [Acaulospora colombiana]
MSKPTSHSNTVISEVANNIFENILLILIALFVSLSGSSSTSRFSCGPIWLVALSLAKECPLSNLISLEVSPNQKEAVNLAQRCSRQKVLQVIIISFKLKI